MGTIAWEQPESVINLRWRDWGDLLRVSNLFDPNSNFGQVNVSDNSATSNYNALQVKFEWRLSQGLKVLASNTWSHSNDISSTDAFSNYFGTPNSVANPNIDRGDSDFDVRVAFTAGLTYALPSPESNKFAHAALGGWSVDSFIFARTAPPVDVVGGLVFADGIALYPRPDVVSGVPLVRYSSQYPGGKAFSPAAFTPPPTGQQGNFGRNVLRGFGAWQADVAFQREFHLIDKMDLRFRGEFFNLFNHPNFGPPDNSLTDALFGQSTQTLARSLASTDNAEFNPLYQIGGRARSSWRSSFNSEQRTKAVCQSSARLLMPPNPQKPSSAARAERQAHENGSALQQSQHSH